MPRTIALLLFTVCALRAQLRTVTLREAVGLALKQNPDAALARLSEQKAVQAVRVAHDPFTPKLSVGSGLAYSSGFPMSIAGATPSIFQAQATQFVFNRPQTYRVAEARENARGASIEAAATREDVAWRAASSFLDAERAARMAEIARRQADTLARIEETVRLRVAEGRELPVEATRAALNLAKARQRAEALEADRSYAEASLAAVLGLALDERLRVVPEERPVPASTRTEDAAVEAALAASQELRKLESAVLAKGLEIRTHRAERLPRLDLVAQYGLLGKFNHYEDFFRRFERHNGQIGISFQIPLITGPAVDALASQAELDAARLRLEANRARHRIALEARRRAQELRQQAGAREVARLDLELAREQLNVFLAQIEEGRATLSQVEEARFAENEKWLAYYDAHYAHEKAWFELLHQTGELIPTLAP